MGGHEFYPWQTNIQFLKRELRRECCRGNLIRMRLYFQSFSAEDLFVSNERPLGMYLGSRDIHYPIEGRGSAATMCEWNNFYPIRYSFSFLSLNSVRRYENSHYFDNKLGMMFPVFWSDLKVATIFSNVDQ